MKAFLATKPDRMPGDAFRTISVGELNSDLEIRPHFATTRAQNGDFL